MANRYWKVETVEDFIFLGSKVTVDSDCSHKIKRCLLLGRRAMTNLECFEKQRHHFDDKDMYSQSESCSVVSNSLQPHGLQHASLPVHWQLPEFTQTHVHWVWVALVMPSNHLILCHPLLFLSQHQGLFKWVRSSHQVVKVLQFQFQPQSFQWIFRTDFL